MDFFNKEYAKYNPHNKSWKHSIFSAIVTFLLFLLFQPFGFKDKEVALKVVLFPGYSLLAFIYTYLNFLIVRQILKKKKKWTLSDELICLLIGIMLLTIAVHLFSYFIAGDMPLTFHWYFKLLCYVASFFLVISIIEFFYYNNKSARINNKKLRMQYELVKQKQDDTEKQNKDIISIYLEKEQMEINKNKIIYIKSVGNYLEFCLRGPDGKINKITKRGRLHNAEKNLLSYSEFFRCHRAFIINLKQVINLRGNVKNARVVFDSNTEKIPVSRSLYKALKEQLEKINLS